MSSEFSSRLSSIGEWFKNSAKTFLSYIKPSSIWQGIKWCGGHLYSFLKWLVKPFCKRSPANQRDPSQDESRLDKKPKLDDSLLINDPTPKNQEEAPDETKTDPLKEEDDNEPFFDAEDNLDGDAKKKEEGPQKKEEGPPNSAMNNTKKSDSDKVITNGIK